MMSSRNIVCALLLLLLAILAACNPSQVEVGNPETPVAGNPSPEAPLATESVADITEETPVPSTPNPEPTPPVDEGTAVPVGGSAICDPLNDFAMSIPDDWRALVPTEGLMGTTTIMNYTDADVEALGPRAQEGIYPPDGIKVDIMTYDVIPGSFDAFIEEQIGNTMTGPGADRRATSEPQPYDIAGFSGVAYTITEEAASEQGSASPPVQVISFPIAADRVTIMSIVPADSTAYDEAIAVLSTYRPQECN